MARDVDILASRKHGTLTIGVIDDIAWRAWKIRSIERDNPAWDDLLQPMGPGNKCRDDSRGCGKGEPFLPEMCEYGRA